MCQAPLEATISIHPSPRGREGGGEVLARPQCVRSQGPASRTTAACKPPPPSSTSWTAAAARGLFVGGTFSSAGPGGTRLARVEARLFELGGREELPRRAEEGEHWARYVVKVVGGCWMGGGMKTRCAPWGRGGVGPKSYSSTAREMTTRPSCS